MLAWLGYTWSQALHASSLNTLTSLRGSCMAYASRGTMESRIAELESAMDKEADEPEALIALVQVGHHV